MKKTIILLDIDDTLAMPINSLIIFNDGLIAKLSQLKKEYGENIEFVCASSYAPQLILQIINGQRVHKSVLHQTKFRLNVINALKEKGIDAPLVATCSPRVNREYLDSDYGADLLALEHMALNLTENEIEELQKIIPTILRLSAEEIGDNINYQRKDGIGVFLQQYAILLQKEKQALSQKVAFNFGEINTLELPEQNTVIETKVEMLLYILENKCLDSACEYKVIFVDDKESVIQRMQALKDRLPQNIQLETVQIPVSEIFIDRKYNNLLEDFTSKLHKDKSNFVCNINQAKIEIATILSQLEETLKSNQLTQNDMARLGNAVDEMGVYKPDLNFHNPYFIHLIEELLQTISDEVIKSTLVELRALFKYQQDIIKDKIEVLFPINDQSVIHQYNQFFHELNYPLYNISTATWRGIFLEIGTITDSLVDQIPGIDTIIEKLNRFYKFICHYENDNLKEKLLDSIRQLNEKKELFQNNWNIYSIIKNIYHKVPSGEDNNKFQERYNAVYKRHPQIFIELRGKDENTILNTLDKYFVNSTYRRLANYLEKELYLQEITLSPLSVHKVSIADKAKQAAQALLNQMDDPQNIISPKELKILKKSTISLHIIYNDYLNEARQLANPFVKKKW